MITVRVNADERYVDEGTTLEQLLMQMGKGDRGYAVAVDDEVVARGDWTRVVLGDGSQVEVLAAVPGG